MSNKSANACNLKSLKHFVIMLCLIAFASQLFAADILVNDSSFSNALTQSVNGDKIVFDRNYFLTLDRTSNLSDIFIYGNKTFLNKWGMDTEYGGGFGGFEDITISNSLKKDGSGAAAYVSQNFNIGIYKSSFSNNEAQIGGAIYVYNDFLGNISDSLFEGNLADLYGGAVSVGHSFEGGIKNTTFYNNTAKGENFGGGALLAGNLLGDIENSLFANNSAYNGGAIYTENAKNIIKDTNFTNNLAIGKGGAIYISGSSNLTLHSSIYMIFEGNTNSNETNAIHFNGYGNNAGNINIITDNQSIMEFKDGISDSNGKLFVTKTGEGILAYDADMDYTGDTNILGGTLFLGNNGSVSSVLHIGDNAVLSVNKTSDYTVGNNVNIAGGGLYINLNNSSNTFSFANTSIQQNFTGTLQLANSKYAMLKNGDYAILLNNNSLASLSSDNSTIRKLMFEGGTLDLNMQGEPLANKTVLSAQNVDITDRSGEIIINSDISGESVLITNDANIYDYADTIWNPAYKIISSANNINGSGKHISVTNISPDNTFSSDIVQNSSVTGEALFQAAATVENDGIYLGFALSKIKSLTNVIFDGINASKNTLNVTLAGAGDFTFTGNKNVYIGNKNSDYTGSTFIINGANATAVSDNALGKTAKINIDENSAFYLNSHSQSAKNLDNNGYIALNGGILFIENKTYNNGAINLGENGSLALGGEGYSEGANSLVGSGTIVFLNDFQINGTNSNLYANVIVENGMLGIDNTLSLGVGKNINLTSANSALSADISEESVLDKDITGFGSFAKLGDSSLRFGGKNSYMGLTNIQKGTLISSADNFFGDINISSAANLIFEQNGNSTLAGQLFGGGNISQIGGHTLNINANAAEFNGIYSIDNGTLQLNGIDFSGTINVPLVSNLIFNQRRNSYFNGTLNGSGSVKQMGGSVLSINSNNENFFGAYAINAGTLRVNTFKSLQNASNISIASDAIYEVVSNQNETLANRMFGVGTISANLGNIGNFFSFSNLTQIKDNFSGTLSLKNAAFVMDKNLSTLSLILNANSIGILSGHNSILSNLNFNGGALDLNITDISIPPELMLSVNNLNMYSEGTIIIDANLSDLANNVTHGLNLYDYGILGGTNKIVNVAGSVYVGGSQLHLKNSSGGDMPSYEIDIIQDETTAGKADFGAVATIKNDGIYLGFGLNSIESLTNVILDSSNASANTLSAVLKGVGNFTFQGNKSVTAGNAASNYTGSTLLKNGAIVRASSNNALGNTYLLTIEKNSSLNLASYRVSQTVGNLYNSGNISMENYNQNRLNVDNYTYNNGTINLGNNGHLSLNGGKSIGDNSLSGSGIVYINKDFNISGNNDNLNANIAVYNASVATNNAKGLGNAGYVNLENIDAKLIFDTSNNEITNKNINGRGSVIKAGDGTLTLNGTNNYTGTTNVLDGTLKTSASNFHGDINISSNANLVLWQQQDSILTERMFGNGNARQIGNYSMRINSDNSNFTGTYHVDGGSLMLEHDSIMGGDVLAKNTLLFTSGDIRGSLKLKESVWQIDSNYDISNLHIYDKSDIYIGRQQQDFDVHNATTLKIKNLSGNGGAFYQRLNLQQNGNNIDNIGDMLDITDSSSGQHTLFFNDKTSGNITLNQNSSILVVKQNNPNGNYGAIFSGDADIGEHVYSVGYSNSSSDKNAYLATTKKHTNTASAALSLPFANYMTNYASDEVVFKRMRELNSNTSTKDNVWIKTYAGVFDSFENEFAIDNIMYYGANLGIDRKYETDSRDLFLGIFAGFLKSDIEYKIGKADTAGYNIGVYASLRDYDNFHLDSIFKYQLNKNSFDTLTSNGIATTGETDTDNIMISLEGGQRFYMPNSHFFIEPQMRATYTYHDKMDMVASNGLKMQIDKFESMRLGVGATLGYNFQKNTSLYLKTMYLKDFNARVKYAFNNYNKEQDFDINWNFFENSLGFISNIKNHQLFIEATYGTGDAFNNIKANLGYRYEF